MIATPSHLWIDTLVVRSAQAVGWLTAFGMVVVTAGILLCLYRIVRGPTLADLGTALDVVGIQLVGLVVLITIRTGTLLYIDGILILTLLAFAGTVAVAMFVARPYISHPRSARVTPVAREPGEDPEQPSREGAPS